MAGELLKVMAKIDIQHIPYKGNNPGADRYDRRARAHAVRRRAIAAAAGQSGRLRAIAISSLKRSPAMPHVPTFDESGMKGYEATNWFGLLAPAKTPREVVKPLNAAVDSVVMAPDFRERFIREGLEAVGGSAESFGAFLREEVDKYARVVKIAGLPKQ